MAFLHALGDAVLLPLKGGCGCSFNRRIFRRVGLRMIYVGSFFLYECLRGWTLPTKTSTHVHSTICDVLLYKYVNVLGVKNQCREQVLYCDGPHGGEPHDTSHLFSFAMYRREPKIFKNI